MVRLLLSAMKRPPKGKTSVWYVYDSRVRYPLAARGSVVMGYNRWTISIDEAKMDDRDLLTQFESCALPFSQWTHRAHVKVAYLYLKAYPFDEALSRIRQHIKAYNAANNRPEGPTMGYNETTTQAFLRLVDTTMRAYGEVFPTPDADSFCDAHPQLMTRNVLRL